MIHILHKCPVDHADASRRGVMSGEIPVARMVGTRLMQPLDTLEHQLDGGNHPMWTQHLDNPVVDLVDSEWLVNRPYMVFARGVGLTSPVNIADELVHPPLYDQ